MGSNLAEQEFPVECLASLVTFLAMHGLDIEDMVVIDLFLCHSPKRAQQPNRCSPELCNTQVVSVGIIVSHSFTTIGITGTAVQGTRAEPQNHSSPHQYSKGSALCWLLIELILDTKSCRTIGTNLMSRGIQASKCFQCSDCLSARDFPK